jgi:hypothetical protein
VADFLAQNLEILDAMQTIPFKKLYHHLTEFAQILALEVAIEITHKFVLVCSIGHGPAASQRLYIGTYWDPKIYLKLYYILPKGSSRLNDPFLLKLRLKSNVHHLKRQHMNCKA